MNDAVDFLPADYQQIFPEIDIIILGMRGKFPSYPK